MKPPWATAEVVNILCGVVIDAALDRCPPLADALEDAGYGGSPINDSNLRFLRGSPHEHRLALASLLTDLALAMTPPGIGHRTAGDRRPIRDFAEMVEEATRASPNVWGQMEAELRRMGMVEADAVGLIGRLGHRASAWFWRRTSDRL